VNPATTSELSNATALTPGLGVSGSEDTDSKLSPWQRAQGISRFGSNVVLTIGTNVLLALMGLGSGPLVARLLGPTGRGQLAAIQNLYWFVATLATLGMSEATLYFIARDPSRGKRILTSSVTLTLLAAPLFVAASYSFAPLFLAAQSATTVKAARLCLLGLPLYAMLVVPISALRGSNDIVRWNLVRLFPALFWLLLLVLVAAFTTPTPRLLGIGYLGILVAAIVPTLIIVVRRLSGNLVLEPRSWSQLLRYGIPLAGASVPINLNLRLDQLLMGAFLPASSLGIYVVAVAWSSAVTPFIAAVGAVLFPRIARASEHSRGALLAQGTRAAMFGAALVVLLTSAATPVAIPLLFGPSFRDSVSVAFLLVTAAGISAMNTVFEEGLRGIAQTSAVMYGEGVGLVITVISLLLLLPPLGILGAGIASIVGSSATAAVLITTLCRKADLSVGEILLIKRRDVGLVLDKVSHFRTSLINAGAKD
jgi:O-antigen/teichoic acid export membrane protein